VNRYFTYCRKSSEDEDHQILSIESQRQELRKYIEREKLQIVADLEEARSAKTPGRQVFNEMLRRIERGDANGILTWHPDRLARNALDGGRIIHLLDTAKLADLRFPTYTFENTSQGKFMLAIMFGQSKYYIDALSENVRRGNRTKREKGWLPGQPPIGYLNGRSDSGDKIIIPDAIRFPLLKKLWNLLLSGIYSVPQLLEIATNEMGLRTPRKKRIGGNPLSVSGIYRAFSNPFYAGYILHDNQWFPARHEPMVTLEQFEKAQQLLGKTNKPRPQNHAFAYTGLIRCGACGCSITAEHKTNRYGSHYIYYHCTRKKRAILCHEKCIEEKRLERQILVFLKTIYLDEREVDKALEAVEAERVKDRATGGAMRQAIEVALERCIRDLDNLTKLRYRDLITDEEFVGQRSELTQEQLKLKKRMEQLGTDQWIEPARNLFLFSNRAVFWLAHGGVAEKRLILNTVGSNHTLAAKEINISARNPFLVLQRRGDFCNWSGVVNDVRTYFTQEVSPDFTIPELKPIPQS
jgi:site-specific DNA recombinase